MPADDWEGGDWLTLTMHLLAKCDPCVFDRMMRIHMYIAIGFDVAVDVEVDQSMATHLVLHAV